MFLSQGSSIRRCAKSVRDHRPGRR
jgi:hypothetical protein